MEEPIQPRMRPSEAHVLNKATLEAIQAGRPPPPNPLLQRTKPKAARKPKPKTKKAAVAEQVESTKKAELAVVSASGAGTSVPDGEEAEVLDLADQLLEQLGIEDESEGQEPLLGETGGSGAAGAGVGLREKMHDLKTGLLATAPEEKKVSRQHARKLRKANHFAFIKTSAQAEVDAANDRSAEDEAAAINEGCQKLGVRLKEIDPDGHCLYSAIADQANVLGLSLTRKETYASTRYYAAHYMRSHPDEFLPFLTSDDESGDGVMTPSEFATYCDTVENTAEWGGQPEINALSKYFSAPIWVLQAGTDLVKVGEDLPPGRGPILISYHRKMYGLGEHYNSLRR